MVFAVKFRTNYKTNEVLVESRASVRASESLLPHPFRFDLFVLLQDEPKDQFANSKDRHVFRYFLLLLLLLFLLHPPLFLSLSLSGGFQAVAVQFSNSQTETRAIHPWHPCLSFRSSTLLLLSSFIFSFSLFLSFSLCL